jgi:hypothetical protein
MHLVRAIYRAGYIPSRLMQSNSTGGVGRVYVGTCTCVHDTDKEPMPDQTPTLPSYLPTRESVRGPIFGTGLAASERTYTWTSSYVDGHCAKHSRCQKKTPVQPRRQTGPTECGDLSRTRVERWKVNHCARGTTWRASCGSMCGHMCVCRRWGWRGVSCRVELELAQRLPRGRVTSGVVFGRLGVCGAAFETGPRAETETARLRFCCEARCWARGFDPGEGSQGGLCSLGRRGKKVDRGSRWLWGRMGPKARGQTGRSVPVRIKRTV